jgi:dolichol-phosphate mannosyltransferase
MLTVIVPTYRERENMAPLLTRLAVVRDGLAEPMEVLVVDNGSEDGTAAEAHRWLTDFRLGRVIACGPDRDLVQAVSDGLAHAAGELIAVMDADLSHPPELLPSLAAAVRGGAELAIASRYAPGGGVANWPASRRALSRVGSWVARPLLGVADGTSGCFLGMARTLRTAPLQARGFKLLPDILVRGHVHRVHEVPYTFTDRVHGQSKLRGRVIVQYAWQLIRLHLHRLTNPCRHPRRVDVVPASTPHPVDVAPATIAVRSTSA